MAFCFDVSCEFGFGWIVQGIGVGCIRVVADYWEFCEGVVLGLQLDLVCMRMIGFLCWIVLGLVSGVVAYFVTKFASWVRGVWFLLVFGVLWFCLCMFGVLIPDVWAVLWYFNCVLFVVTVLEDGVEDFVVKFWCEFVLGCFVDLLC